MYEFHGWAVIRETPENVDELNLNEILHKIRKYIDDLYWDASILKLIPVNGIHQILVSGFSNHKSAEAEELMGLYNYVADIASGSYGMLYVRDSFDTNGHDNEFIVYVLARGKFHEHKDPFLSPFIPTVEDEFDE